MGFALSSSTSTSPPPQNTEESTTSNKHSLDTKESLSQHRSTLSASVNHNDDSAMPWIEPKKRVGTAGKRRSLDRVPPKPVWPGLDHNGRPIPGWKDETANDDETISNDDNKGGGEDDDHSNEGIEALPPMKARSRKRKNPIQSVWKEIMDEGKTDDAPLPEDLQADDSSQSKRFKPEHKDEEPLNTATRMMTTEGEMTEASGATVAPLQNLQEIFQHWPSMVKGISHIQSMLEKLVHSSGAVASGKDHQKTPALERQDQILSRMESLAERQEGAHRETVENLQRRVKELQDLCQKQEASLASKNSHDQQEHITTIRRLENEARQSDDVIKELQRAQENERRESQIRVTEALQKIEQLQGQNEKLQRRNTKLQAVKGENAQLRETLRRLTTSAERQAFNFAMGKSRNNSTGRPIVDSRAPRNRSSSLDGGVVRPLSTSRSKLVKLAAVKSSDSSTASNPFESPARRGEEISSDVQSDDSPFSAGSASSTKAVSRRGPKRIVPGTTLQTTTNKKRDDGIVMNRTSLLGGRRSHTKTNIRDLVPNYALDSLARSTSP